MRGGHLGGQLLDARPCRGELAGQVLDALGTGLGLLELAEHPVVLLGQLGEALGGDARLLEVTLALGESDLELLGAAGDDVVHLLLGDRTGLANDVADRLVDHPRDVSRTDDLDVLLAPFAQLLERRLLGLRDEGVADLPGLGDLLHGIRWSRPARWGR